MKGSFGAGFEANSNLIFREIPVWINLYQLKPSRLVFEEDPACTYKLRFFGLQTMNGNVLMFTQIYDLRRKEQFSQGEYFHTA